MARNGIPKYGYHKASGQARVLIGGRHLYLGPYGSPQSREAYARAIAEQAAAPASTPEPAKTRGIRPLTISALLLAYLEWADQYYRRADGKPTSEATTIRYAMRPLRLLYGAELVADFGPLKLRALREHLIAEGRLCRGEVNRVAKTVRRLFRWAAGRELCAPSIPQALGMVEPLRAGRTTAREAEPVKPVAIEVVDATMPHLPEVVADLLRLQLLCGMRPGEVCAIRPADVDTSGDVWAYRPATHKNAYRGKERTIFIGPKGQDILRRYLLRPAEAFCFSPAESERKRKSAMRAARRSPVQPSQVDRSKPRPKRKPRQQYTPNALNHTIRRACLRAFPAPGGLSDDDRRKWDDVHRWHMNQLRHTAATLLRAQFGLEAAKVTLGHSTIETSQIYAERDNEAARRIASQVG